MGTLGDHFLSRAFVHKSVSGVRAVNLHACATECGESDDTSVDVGNLRCFYAQHPRFIASSFSPTMSFDEFWQQRNPTRKDLWDKYDEWLWSSQKLDDRTLRAKSDFYTEHLERWESRHEERVKYRTTQVHRARAITSISPATLLQHLIEAFAGTGFERHLQFVENAQRYARQLREFVADTDRSDPESLHIIGVREGMSQKPVSPEAVPRFEDTLSLSKDFNTTAMEMLLLALFVVVLLAGAYLAFVRVEV